MAARQYLIGRKFARLTVIADIHCVGRSRVRCRCECGNVKEFNPSHLKDGRTKSCGCLNSETASRRATERNFEHGLTSHPLHGIWTGIIDRTRNPLNYAFKNYGGRGIDVCDRWLVFENFIADMGPRPKGHSVDRIDNEKGYSPENCRWATHTTQVRNSRHNTLVTFRGETRCVSEWCEKLGLRATAIRQRLNALGWSVERAFTEPVQVHTRRPV